MTASPSPPLPTPPIDQHASTTDDLEDGQIPEVDMDKQAGDIRTVFSDPDNFNVKHPLYSPWTLWFDSPQAKGRNMPQTPVTAAPQTPLPTTPAATEAAGGWMDDIKKVISFDSVEEFWGLYNNIVPPSQLPQKANYYLFREGIIPAWEDDANKNGGKWSIQLPKDKNRSHVDTMWLHTLLAAIGETFDSSALSSISNSDADSSPNANANADANTNSNDDTYHQSLVTGVIVSVRPQFYRLSIWTRIAPAHHEEALRLKIESVGKHFKMNVLGYGETQKLAAPLATEVEFMSHKESEKKGKRGGAAAGRAFVV